MWIRGQDKEILVKVSSLKICETFHNKGCITRSIDCETEGEIFELGQYSSERKALKVLDMIETRLRQCYHDTTMIVFQMPSDEEVED